MNSIFDELSEKNFKKDGDKIVILEEMFKILKEHRNSLKLEELCQNIVKLWTGKSFKDQLLECRYWLYGISDDSSLLNDINITEKEKENTKEHLEFIKTKLEQEEEKLGELIKINLSLKSPISALSDKIGSSEFERINIRGPKLLEAISDALSFILTEKSPDIDDIIWSKKGDYSVYNKPPIRILFFSENPDANTIIKFLNSQSKIVEPLLRGKESREELIKLFQNLPFFEVDTDGVDVYIEIHVFIFNILYKKILELLNRKEERAREVLANELGFIMLSELFENLEELNYHKQIAILLSFILKNFILKDGKFVSLDVERVFISDDEECENILKIANALILPKVLAHHKNVKVKLIDVKETLKFYFRARRGIFSDLGIIRSKPYKGRTTTTMDGEPKTDSLLYKTQSLVEDAIKADIFRDHFQNLTW